MVEDGFVVRAGSTGKAVVTDSAQVYCAAQRERLKAAGVIVQDGDRVRFTQDHLFSSPGAASVVVMGRNSNGWLVWKDAEGHTRHQVYRAGTSE